MKKIIVANWKCNPKTLKEAEELLLFLKKNLAKIKHKIVLAPPFIYLPLAKKILTGTKISLSAQNCFWKEGPFTGEISPKMLKSVGVKYLILGHSERRIIFNETNLLIAKKIKSALKEGLFVIVCIGETKKERERKRTFQVLKEQITQSLSFCSKKEFQRILIAYEPVWAIGTKLACKSEEVVKISLFLKKVLLKKFPKKDVLKIKILYGGSVNSKNVKEYLKEEQIAGVLVGGASLLAEEFKKIAKS